jgi:large subunit ribosomal protein L23
MARMSEQKAVNEKLFHVIVAPHVSEKSSRLADKYRQIVLEVRRTATKPEIKQAVESLFNVQVESVTVVNVGGKVKQTGRMSGRRKDWKKAYVRLKPGQDIDFLGQQA